MSDIVFLRSWVPVSPPKLYNPITDLLTSDKDSVVLMKTTADVRRERGIGVPLARDSQYKVWVEVHRTQTHIM